MFQTFDATTRPDEGPPRLAALREVMAGAGVDGFLVPRADRFMGEYVAPCDERLAWLTGFTGSAGFAAVLPDVAGVFVDGRYRLQVREQCADVYTPVDWPEVGLADWLREHATGTIAYDPMLHTVSEIEALETALAGTGIVLAPSVNLVDQVWPDRPGPPLAPFFAHPEELAGQSVAEKIGEVADILTTARQGAVLLTQPDSIAWLLNIRGADIPRNPVPHAMALLSSERTVTLFCDPSQAEGLRLEAITLAPEAELPGRLGPAPLRIDPRTCPVALFRAAEATGEVQRGDDPCALPKARKTAAEIAGAMDAQSRDGVAMVRFLHWLDQTAPAGGLSEIDVVSALEGFRRDTNALRDISFETICGAGPNGAIVHYRVTFETNRAVKPGEMLLVDSGGQYVDGTTDITRTVAVGEVPEAQRQAFTRVLKGVIALSSLRWPAGVAGAHIDGFARAALWQAGLDYGHGTGHGIGSYLCVHEGPQNLSRRSNVPLETGMILSIEPGHYREGEYGIRIENLAAVREAPEMPGQDPIDFLEFQTLTYVPIDRRLIVPSMLTRAETDWINGYHKDVVKRLSDALDTEVEAWLAAACAPI